MEVHESYPPSAIPWAADKEVLAVLDADGRADASRDPRLPLELVRKIYQGMLRTRLIDLRLTKLQRQGRIGFHVGAEGEEAAIIASAAAMRAQEGCFPATARRAPRSTAATRCRPTWTTCTATRTTW